MKKLLLTFVCTILVFSLAACNIWPDVENPNEQEPIVGGESEFDQGNITIETAYAKAQSLGYDGSLEDFIEMISGKDGEDGEDGQNGKDGADGKDGKDGVTPTVEISDDGYWIINGVKTEHRAVGTDGKDGQDGIDGKDGTDGEDGVDGSDAVGVIDAYVDATLHLWIVLSDGTKIDAGYVGVKTEPTPDPEPDITEPTIIVSNATASAGATNVEITVALKNNPGVTSMLIKIAFDDSALELVSMTYNTTIGGTGIPNASKTSPITAYWAEGFNNVMGDWVFVTLSFNVSNSALSGDYDISVTYNADDVFNADETNIDFEIINGKITVS